MTKEERELLIKDLCARLPYGLKGLVTTHWDKEYVGILKGIKSGPMLDIPQLEIMYDNNIHNVGLGDFKPYLRPQNSITPKESREFQYIFNNIYRPSVSMIDKNCEYHLDFRDLIPRCLALEAPQGIYDTSKFGIL